MRRDTMSETATAVALDFVEGDFSRLSIPAHADALQAGGEKFLTEAFRTFGALDANTRVARIVRIAPCPGGSTGQKLFLSVQYDPPSPQLCSELFVKFSRDFNDAIRDRGRYEMAAEVRFALLSRHADFPIHVPATYFADYQQASGTGLLITQRIGFGSGGIEPQHGKCLDHELVDPLSYYRAVVRALARLAAAHKAGQLSAAVDAHFPFDVDAAIASDPIRYSEQQLREQVARFADFAAIHPQLLPDNLREPALFAQLADEVALFLRHESLIKRYLQSRPEFIALCHWNAHLDNAWFWRDQSGELQCGLMDWGRVSQMNVAYALWGCLSGASLSIWNEHLPQLLQLFVDELREHGGPALDIDELLLHLQLYVAMMGLAWLLDAPARILFRLPQVAQASGPHDPLFRDHESARNQLHISSVLLNFWQRYDFGASLQRLLARQ